MPYVRFPLSLRHVEDLLHDRGIDVSHETVRYWWNKFGLIFGCGGPAKAPRLEGACGWGLREDQRGTTYLWRAVGHEGEMLQAYASKRRKKDAALAFLKKAMKRCGNPEAIVADRPASYKAALRELNSAYKQDIGRRFINRVENSRILIRR